MTCSHTNDKIIESRYTASISLGNGTGRIPISAKRRIHSCLDCSHRWTTYEIAADALRTIISSQAELESLRDRIGLIQDALTCNL